jgi:hypothetical protein
MERNVGRDNWQRVAHPRGLTGRHAVPNGKEALHATIDEITADVAQLKAVETTKRDLAPGDPRATALAEEAVAIARRLLPKTVTERAIVDEIRGG